MTKGVPHREWLAVFSCALTLTSCSAGEQPLDRVEQSVLAGQPSPESQDSVVALLFPGNSGCTAEVVAPRLLMTARHCLFEAVGVGSTYLRCGVGGDGTPVTQAMAPADITVWRNHKKPLKPIANGKRIYGGPALNLCDNDIALVELDRAVDLTPLALRLDTDVVVGEVGTLVGWGAAEGEQVGGLAMQRRQLALSVLAVGPTNYPIDVANISFIADQGGCYGDSGGPFLSRAGAVVGILSSVELADIAAYDGSPAVSNCIGGKTVFNKLSQQRTWIEAAFASAGERPTAEGLGTPAALGARCSVDEECTSGICQASASTHFCSAHCEDEACPVDMQCVGEPGARLCVPARVPVPATSSGGCSVDPLKTASGAPTIAVAWLALSLFARRRYRRLNQSRLLASTP